MLNELCERCGRRGGEHSAGIAALCPEYDPETGKRTGFKLTGFLRPRHTFTAEEQAAPPDPNEIRLVRRVKINAE